MSAIGNFLWFIFGGGLVAGLLWALSGLIMFVSIIGIPWGHSCFRLANLTFFPFGRTAIDRRLLDGQPSVGTGVGGTLGNIVWFILAGLWLAIGHALAGISYCLTIIGIPFGIQHFKLGGLALAPIGKEVVSLDVAAAARARAAGSYVSDRRGDDSKVCPSCRREIKAQAVICRHCGHEQP